MADGLSANRKIVLALSVLAALALVSLGGTGSAIAADRMVIAESFVNTG